MRIVVLAQFSFAFGALLPATPLDSEAQVVARMEDDGIPRVVATATKTARATPDRVWFYAIVEGAAESAAEAAQRADRKLQAVVDAARQLGARAEVTPYGVQQTPAGFPGYPGQSSANPFTARHMMRIQLSRLDQLMSSTTALMAAGATTITPPSFEASNADSLRRAKFAEALAQAKGDAESIAAGLGMRLGQLVDVSSTSPPQNMSGNPYFNFSRGFDLSGTMMPDVMVSATVTVRYRLQK
jgi:uncharacterized protein